VLRFTDRALISAPPSRVWEWFADLDRNYLAWHPEHLVWRTVSGEPLHPGAVVYFDEWIGRFRLAGQLRITASQPGKAFHWQMKFPYTLVGVGGSFAVTAVGPDCDLVADVQMGWNIPVLGPALDWLIGKVVPLPELRRHMAEEGQNLARLLGPASEREVLRS
jgi:hypothetical protein